MTLKIGAVILAAGESSRMGRPKALLPLREGESPTFLGRLAATARRAGLEPLRIVVGKHGREIEEAHPELSDCLVLNERPDLGQLHSLRLGLESMGGVVDAAVIFLVDHPFVTMETVQALMEAYSAEGKPIIIPVCRGRRGHPVLFGRELFGDIFHAPLEQGARHVVRSHPDLVKHLEVDDPGVLADIDTPEDYEKAGSYG
jgi:molybdenum cofactor cytidylyltransferase